jgi:hypothetical protein
MDPTSKKSEGKTWRLMIEGEPYANVVTILLTNSLEELLAEYVNYKLVGSEAE